MVCVCECANVFRWGVLYTSFLIRIFASVDGRVYVNMHIVMYNILLCTCTL